MKNETNPKYNNPMKIDIIDNKIKMEIAIDDVISLFENCEYNEILDIDGFSPSVTVKRDKKEDFIKYIINSIYSEYNQYTGTSYWEIVFEKIFEKLLEDCVDFLNYNVEY